MQVYVWLIEKINDGDSDLKTMATIDVETIIYITLDLILAFLVLFGNVLVCCVVVYSRELRKKVSYKLMFHYKTMATNFNLSY